MSQMRALFFGLLAGVMSSHIATEDKQTQAKELNKQSGGVLFNSSPYGPTNKKNQRQRRKLHRQNPHLRNRK